MHKVCWNGQNEYHFLLNGQPLAFNGRQSSGDAIGLSEAFVSGRALAVEAGDVLRGSNWRAFLFSDCALLQYAKFSFLICLNGDTDLERMRPMHYDIAFLGGKLFRGDGQAFGHLEKNVKTNIFELMEASLA